MKISHIVVTSVLVMLSQRTLAADIFVEGGIHLGGDTIVEVAFTNGDTEKLKAGELLSLALGVQSDISETLQGRVSIGYKFDSISADNGDLDFTRMPLEVLVMNKGGYWMLGGGIGYHLSPKLKADAISIGLSGTADFDDALGFVLAADYNSKGEFAGDWYLGGRITIIDYENQFGSISGNSVGVVLGYMF